MNEFQDYDLEADLAVKTKTPTRSGPEGQLAVDIFEDEDDVIIQSTIAGVTDKDLDISITKDMATIKGRRSPDSASQSAKYHHQELYWGAFSRSIILPVDVDADAAKATLKNGLLTIRLPKLEKRRVKKLTISG